MCRGSRCGTCARPYRNPTSMTDAIGSSSLKVAPDDAPPRRLRVRPLLNVGGWLLFGTAMMIGSLDVMPWDVILATESVYVVVGFLLAMLLGRVYDRLGVGPAFFGRTLAISAAGSIAAGMLWNVAFYYHRQYGAAILYSLIIGVPS